MPLRAIAIAAKLLVREAIHKMKTWEFLRRKSQVPNRCPKIVA